MLNKRDDGVEAARRALGGDALSRRQLLIAGGILGAGAIAGCGSSTRSKGAGGSPASRSGGSLTWGADTDPTFLIPIGANAAATWRVTSLIYESLLRWDRNLKVQPALAESWKVPDSRTFIFHLRKDVRFHSGKAFDAEDVKYSIEKQRKPPSPGIDMGFFPPIDTVEIVDKYTVRLNMSSPAALTLGFFAWNRSSSIVPSGFYESTDVRTHTDGTGPFKLEDYVPNDHVKLVRNPHYWRPGAPKVDDLTIKILPDEGARFAALRSRAIDGATFSPDTARIAKRDSNLQVLRGLTASFNELEFTLKDSSKPWYDARVRRAVNAAINRQEIIDKVFSGNAVFSGKIAPGYGDWPIPQAELKSKYERYDVQQAKALLREAGHTNGFEVTLDSIADPKFYTQVAEVVKDQLKQVGINVRVQPMEIGTFAKHDGDGTFEWESTGRGMRGDPSGFLADFDPKGGLYKAWYAGGWKNEELTGLIRKGISTVDNAKRHALYRRMEEIVLTEWPVMPLVDQYKFQIVGKRVQGMYVSYTDADPGLVEAAVG
jgi:peptide/nickel transport system substrate-binding protein